LVQVSVSADALTRTPQGQRSLVDFQFFAQSDGTRDGVFVLHAVELMFPAARDNRRNTFPHNKMSRKAETCNTHSRRAGKMV